MKDVETNQYMIPLTKGQYVVVSEEDYNHFMQWSWYIDSSGYAARSENFSPTRETIKVYMHREILERKQGRPIADDCIADHWDRDRHNNRRENLREISQSLNTFNGKKQSNNTSGIVGVSWWKKRNKWRAYIVVKRKQKHLGQFDELHEAILVRLEAELLYYGEYNNDYDACMKIVNESRKLRK